MRPAIMRGSMAFPIERVNVARLKQACTIQIRPMGEPEPIDILTYKIVKDYIHVPRQLGLQVCRREGIEYEDQTSPGHAVKFPFIPEPRDYQIEALLDIDATMDDFYDFLFRARTGWGKTFGSLIVAARRGISTLIIVDQENLKDQWIKTLVEGFRIDPKNIGTIQGDTVKFAGCPVTIAMVQTLSQRTFTREIYDYFGLIFVDETHIIGAPTFSKVLMDFSAGYRIGVSATPKRRDGLQKMLDYHLGKVRIYIDDEHDENSVWITEHGTCYSWYANVSPKVGRFINEISEDGARNLHIAESASYLYDTGRDVLVLSDRIEHLKHLMSLCEYMGIPAEDMGLYAGYNPIYGYDKEATPSRRPVGITKHEDGKVYFTPVSLQLIAKRTKKKVLEDIKADARIIFATYGMFAKGVDVPRLNGGVDASPRSTAEQVHGRILRKVEGKLRSIWITIADTQSYRSLHGLLGRIPDYLRNNAKVFRWSLNEGEELCNVKALKAELREEVDRLKSMRIETSKGGLHTLVTQSDRVTLAKQHAKDISERTRLRADSRTGSSPEGRTVKSSRVPSKPQSSERASPSRRLPRR